MGEARAYSLVRKVNFVLFDPLGISPNKGNVLIRKMRKALEDFRLDGACGGHVKMFGVIVDPEVEIWQHNPNMVHGEWEIRVEMVDTNEDNGAIERWNNVTHGVLGKELCQLRFSRYKTLIKIVENHSEPGDLSVTNPTEEPKMSEAQLIFYKRFSKAVFNNPWVSRLLILDKEAMQIKNDKTLPDETKEKLKKDVDRFINSCKQNMSEKELKEYRYFAISLGSIPSI